MDARIAVFESDVTRSAISSVWADIRELRRDIRDTTSKVYALRMEMVKQIIELRAELKNEIAERTRR